MTIFEHRTIGLLEEIRDLLLKLTSQPPNDARNSSGIARNRPKRSRILRNPLGQGANFYGIVYGGITERSLVYADPSWLRTLQKRRSNREHSQRLETGRRRGDPGDLTPRTEIAVAKWYPEWAKKDLRSRGYIVDDAQPQPNTTPEPSSTLIETSRHYPEHIRRAFAEIQAQGRGAKLSMPG